MFGFGMEMFGPPRIPFNREYKCFSVSMMPGHERQDVENGGKIILPPSALDHLTRLNTAYPMLFKLTNAKKNRMTHCGVLEFVADEGRCYIPHWMMRNLLLEEGSNVKVQSVSLPVANFSKFEPQSSQFLDITNPKAVLENALRNFACLTVGDIVAIRYNDRIYEMRVLETKPGNAVSIIECDMEVDFAPAPDYVEPIRQPTEDMEVPEESIVADSHGPGHFRAFGGSGNRLDGKAAEVMNTNVNGGPARRGIPDYDYKVGTIHFFRNNRLPSANPRTSKEENGFKAFEGTGLALRPPPVSSTPAPVPPPPPPANTQNQIIPFNLANLTGNMFPDANPSTSPSSYTATPMSDIEDIDDLDDDIDGGGYNYYNNWQSMTLPTPMSIPLPPPTPMPPASQQEIVVNSPPLQEDMNQDDELNLD